MANEEHVRILKQGVGAWNEWKGQFHGMSFHPDLVGADLAAADLQMADFHYTDLSSANLQHADLEGAYFLDAQLLGANLRKAHLQGVNFTGADLSQADLTDAKLRGANFLMANLTNALLAGTILFATNMQGANLAGTNVHRAKLWGANFSDVDLSEVQGLTTVEMLGPSTIGIDTIYRSQGRIPEKFLREAGVPDSFITYSHSLITKPIEFYSCFISYSNKDLPLAQHLHADLRAKEVRCWFAPEDMKIGDRLRARIDESIQVHDKLLLVLSESSVASPWVEREVVAAMEREDQQGREVLFPIRLDDAVMETDQAWAAEIRRTRHIGDFTRWKEHDEYQATFDRLLRDLKAEGG